MNHLTSLLAHYDQEKPKKTQFLVDHLLEVAKGCKNLGRLINLGSICQLIGLLHDFGKNRETFQLYIKGEYKGRVDHSSAGGIILGYIADEVYEHYDIKNLLKSKKFKERDWDLYREILQYPILAHHGLYDIIDNNFNYRTGLRLNSNKGSEYDLITNDLEFLNLLNGAYINLNNTSIHELYYKGFKEFIEINKTIKNMVPNTTTILDTDDRIRRMKSLHFYYGALTRLLLSILKDADIYDSSNYYRKDKHKTYSQEELNGIWGKMGQSIEKLYDEFDKKQNKSELDIVRTKLANEIYDFSFKHGKGAFKLDMPVGLGKTYAGLRYAIGNAKQFEKTRVFYCTAFLSVLEQNASSIRDVLGDKYILEHHSNIIQDYDGKEEEQDQKDYEVYEYLKESWETPVILTSVVQLSNTLFKHRASNIRRFSKLINSVIIIDEIQSLPTKALYNFNLMTNFLTNIMNCTVIHSTATPPNFDNKDALAYPCNYGHKSGESSIIKPIERLEVFSRVDYYSLLGKNLDKTLNSKELVEHIKGQLEKEKSVLVVLNTKRAVLNIYNELNQDTELMEDEVEVIYLTTNQCPKHRLEVIHNMKERLKNIRNSVDKRKIICVSTKLVEAGVDIDFDIAYRSLSGIDSVIQVAGRCNREGKKVSNGKLFIFKYEDENLQSLWDIQKQIEASETALRIMSKDELVDGKIDIERACEYYFHKLYLNEGAGGNNLEYPIKDKETIFNLLTNNPNGYENYKNQQGSKPHFILRQSFKTAAIEFDLIKENAISVIVQYKNDELIEEMYKAIEDNDYYNIKNTLKRLQPYTISIRRVVEYGNYITQELDGEILILSKEAYSKEVGLIKGELELLSF